MALRRLSIRCCATSACAFAVAMETSALRIDNWLSMPALTRWRLRPSNRSLRAASRCGVRAGLVAMLVTMLAFYAVLIPARPYIQKPGTKDIAGVVKAAAGPRDRIYHYRGFFHDFTYYTGREVGLVEATDELEVQFLRPEERAARFIDEAELRREWAGPGRIWLIGRRSALQPLMNDPSFRYRVAAESRGHCLLTNRPAIPGP